MPENQDQPRTPIPAPTPLLLYTFKDPNVVTGVINEAAKTSAPEQYIRLSNGVALIRNFGIGPVTITVSDLSGRIVQHQTVGSMTLTNLRQWVGRGTFVVTAAVSGKQVYSGIVVNISHRDH